VTKVDLLNYLFMELFDMIGIAETLMSDNCALVTSCTNIYSVLSNVTMDFMDV